jgi:hypothetical protein
MLSMIDVVASFLKEAEKRDAHQKRTSVASNVTVIESLHHLFY